MANVAEGFESRTTPLFIEFLGRARGSAGEVRAHLYTALDVGYLSAGEFDELAQIALDASRCITGLMKYLGRNKNAYRLRTANPHRKGTDNERLETRPTTAD